MKHLLTLLVFSVSLSYSQTVSIIPQPSFVEVKGGTFTITPATKIVVPAEKLSGNASLLNDYLQQLYGITLPVTRNRHLHTNDIYLGYDHTNRPEGAYNMTIDDQEIRIAGEDDAGVFYALQSLLQLLPAQKVGALTVPQVRINDTPRFAYRGMHLDVARHFFTVAQVKKYIDFIAMHKMNTFHWHLTEDQGWRIEIKKYPKLTEEGACRNGTIIGHYPGKGNDSIRYCGYYTQDQIRDIVKYAAARYVTIIPEIEMPGHSSAALTAYPELGCTGGPYKVQETWGVFDDVYCAGNEKTFQFLEDVIDEVIQLFPSQYIHIGGDECPKTSWKKCPKCQQRMKDNHLADEHSLQSYFIQRMEKYINSKGRKIIGWDEILEGGLAPNASVMSWRGEEGGIAAAKQHHTVVMTPEAYCYFDRSPSKNEDSVVFGGYVPIEKVYGYEPVPAVLTPVEAKYILGAQANVWTEYIANQAKLEYMIFPRMAALSEVLWSPKRKRNWSDFEQRLQVQFKRYDLWNVNYNKAYFAIADTVMPSSDHKGLVWKLDSRCPNPIYKATLADKDEYSTFTYHKATEIPVYSSLKGSIQLINGNSGVTVSTIERHFSFNKATGRSISLAAAPTQKYPGNGGAFGLVNGLVSEKGTNSTEWLGWNGKDMEATIDLGTTDTIHSVIIHALEQRGSWIYRPASLIIQVSQDGSHYTDAGNTADFVFLSDKVVGNMQAAFPATAARYIKVIARNFGVIPAGLPGADNHAWLFVDEIGVE